jgi:hypothetical protein
MQFMDYSAIFLLSLYEMPPPELPQWAQRRFAMPRGKNLCEKTNWSKAEIRTLTPQINPCYTALNR